MSALRFSIASASVVAAAGASAVGYWAIQHLLGKPLRFDDPWAPWIGWALPALVSAAVAAIAFTRRTGWTTSLRATTSRVFASIRIAALASAVFFPLQIGWEYLIDAFGKDGSGGRWPVGAFVFAAYIDCIVIAVGFIPAVVLEFIALTVATKSGTKDIQ